MDAVFLKILNMSLTAGWLIAAVLLMRLLLHKAPASLRVVLWGLVGVRLCCPVSLKSLVSLIPSAQPISPTIATDPVPGIDSGLPPVNAVVNPMITESLTPATGDSVNPLQVIVAVAATVWLVGVAGLLVYAAVGYWRMRRRVQASLLLEGNVYLCDAVASPFILGLLRARIYLPSGLSDAAAVHILAHERAHLRRGDHWIKALGFLLLAVHWFNPLVWVAYAVLCRDIELACDERVIRLLDGAGKRTYSETLLACGAHKRTVLACPLAFGENSIKTRVKAVLHYKKPAFWLSLVGVLAVVAGAVFFLTDPLTDQTTAALVPEGFPATVLSANFEDGHRLLVKPETTAAREKYGERVSVLTALEYWMSQPYTNPYVTAGDRVWIEVGEALLAGDAFDGLYPVERYVKLPAQSELSLEQTVAITAFVTQPEHNGLIGSLHEYRMPKEIDLNLTLYDGCGISRRTEALTAEEIAAGVLKEYVAVQVFNEADVERFLQQRLGVGVAELTNGIGDVTHFEELGLYAIYHSDTNLFEVVVDSIAKNARGQYEVVYHDALDDAAEPYVVTLRSAGDGYRFVSNTPKKSEGSSQTTTTTHKADSVKSNKTVVVGLADNAIVVDAKEHYVHRNDNRYASAERLAFVVDNPGDYAVGDAVQVVHTGVFVDGEPPLGYPNDVQKLHTSTMTFDETLANNIGITYAQAEKKYGAKVEQMGYRGGPFLRFKNAAAWMLFENATYNFIDSDKSGEVIIDPDGRCEKIIATVGDVFKNTGNTIAIRDIEQLLGCTVTTQDDMSHGDHQIIFTYNRRRYVIEIFPASDTVKPSDRLLVM